jgi:hypothetical protein
MVGLLQQQQPTYKLLRQHVDCIAPCVLLLCAYRNAVQAWPQHTQAYTSEAIAALARVADWSQQFRLNCEAYASRSSSGSGIVFSSVDALLVNMWDTSITLITLLLGVQIGSTPGSIGSLDGAAQALDSSGKKSFSCSHWHGINVQTRNDVIQKLFDSTAAAVGR